MALQPHSSGVRIQDLLCSIIKDKYMMKAQVHVSKSSAISDEQALPQKNIIVKSIKWRANNESKKFPRTRL
nr:hypothetical protein [Tanacetum cinerariifolium]